MAAKKNEAQRKGTIIHSQIGICVFDKSNLNVVGGSLMFAVAKRGIVAVPQIYIDWLFHKKTF